jgi:hypothetical protein
MLFAAVDGDDLDATYSCAEPGRTEMSYSLTSSGRKIVLESQETSTSPQISSLFPASSSSSNVRLADTNMKNKINSQLSNPSIVLSATARAPKTASATITSGNYQNSSIMIEHAHMLDCEENPMSPWREEPEFCASQIEVE